MNSVKLTGQQGPRKGRENIGNKHDGISTPGSHHNEVHGMDDACNQKREVSRLRDGVTKVGFHLSAHDGQQSKNRPLITLHQESTEALHN